MKDGKLTNEKLKKIVLERLPEYNSEVLTGAGIGLDCALIKSREGIMAVTSDPVTAASADAGKIAVNISCNDIACCGINPVAMTLVIIAPSNTKEKEMMRVVDSAAKAAEDMGVSIVGGHTEVSDAVNRFILMTTAFGFTNENNAVRSDGAKSGDSILMTKYAALEGSAILAADYKDLLKNKMSEKDIEIAEKYIDEISVVKEALICSKIGVNAMHDVTEGGILGAVWEMAQASDLGCIVEIKDIPVTDRTKKICSILNLDPYRLISSGSMLIASDKPDLVIEELGKNSIRCEKIGEFTKNKRQYRTRNGQIHEIQPPGADELYKIVQKD